MRRAALLLLLVAVWYYCADLAQMVGGDTRRTQYLANGIFGAAVCLLWRDESKDSMMRGAGARVCVPVGADACLRRHVDSDRHGYGQHLQ